MAAVAFSPAAEQVASLVGRTLEEAAFIVATRCASPAPFEAPLLAASLAFRGPAGESASLVLVAQRSLARTLAANLLGVEPDDEEVDQRAGDALGELCNIAGGMLMVELFGSEAVCPLCVPQTRLVAQPPAGLASLLTDDGERIDVGLLPEPGA
jgi:hypothetical protein